jgi:hypothetical protein
MKTQSVLDRLDLKMMGFQSRADLISNSGFRFFGL